MREFLEAIAGGLRSGDDGRIYGLLYGTIKEVEDPSDSKSMGRVKARVGAMQDNDVTTWLDPAWPGSLECYPRKNDPCFVAFIDGDPHRGVYWWHPATTTKDRPSEWAMLGTMFAGMYNDLAAKFNTLKGKYNDVVTDLNTLKTLLGTTGLVVSGATALAAPGTPVIVATTDSDADAGKIKDTGGSVVGAKSGDQVALSGNVKIGK